VALAKPTWRILRGQVSQAGKRLDPFGWFESDPNEKHNLLDNHRDVVDSMVEELSEWLSAPGETR
jgi:hypothetical protein